MTKPLYEISDQYLAALEQLEELELDEQSIKDTLEAITGEVEEKSIAVAKYFQNLEAEAKTIKDAMEKMKLRHDALKNQAQRLKDYLKENMERTGITKIACPYFELAVVKNPAHVVIDDADALPKDAVTIVTTKKIDKKVIREKMDETGGGVPGAHLEQTTRLRIK